MIKMTMLLKRKSDITLEQFIDHHINVHGEMMRSIPEAHEHLVRYLKIHPGKETTSEVSVSGFDGVAELWFDSMTGLDAVTAKDAQGFFEHAGYRHTAVQLP